MEDNIAIIEAYGDFIEKFIYFIVGVYIILIAYSYIFVFFFPIRFNTYICTDKNKNWFCTYFLFYRPERWSPKKTNWV